MGIFIFNSDYVGIDVAFTLIFFGDGHEFGLIRCPLFDSFIGRLIFAVGFEGTIFVTLFLLNGLFVNGSLLFLYFVVNGNLSWFLSVYAIVLGLLGNIVNDFWDVILFVGLFFTCVATLYGICGLSTNVDYGDDLGIVGNWYLIARGIF